MASLLLYLRQIIIIRHYYCYHVAILYGTIHKSLLIAIARKCSLYLHEAMLPFKTIYMF